jgi:hypothetical protein
MKHYLISVNNQELGPLSEVEVIDLIKRGYIPPISRCKLVGEDQWYSIKEIEIFEENLKALDANWDENTVIQKIIELDSINEKLERKEITLKTIEKSKTQKKIESTQFKTNENFDLEKTIISPHTKKYLENEVENKKNNEVKNSITETPAKEIVKSTDKTVIVTKKDYMPEVLKANEQDFEMEWEKTQKKKSLIRKKNQTRQKRVHWQL